LRIEENVYIGLGDWCWLEEGVSRGSMTWCVWRTLIEIGLTDGGDFRLLFFEEFGTRIDHVCAYYLSLLKPYFRQLLIFWICLKGLIIFHIKRKIIINVLLHSKKLLLVNYKIILKEKLLLDKRYLRFYYYYQCAPPFQETCYYIYKF